MKISIIARNVLAGLLMCLPPATQAQGMFGLVGSTDTDDHSQASYGWQVGFEKSFYKRLSGSLSWLNEGHLQDNHRDGALLQLWVNGFNWYDRTTLSFGIGPYVYFDTQPSAAAHGYNNLHGVGVIASSSLALRMSKLWSLRLGLNAIYSPSRSSTRSVLIGAEYHYGGMHWGAIHDHNADPIDLPHQEIQVFGGTVITNSLDSYTTSTMGVDYRIEYAKYAAWSATWFYNPKGQNGQHNRIASELWLVDHFNRHFSFSAGAGAYGRLGGTHDNTDDDKQDIDGLFSLRADWHWTPRIGVIFTGYRRYTKNNKDRDMLVLGVGWRFGSN